MDESTRNRIARYVRRGERSAPPEFVGRKTELNRFREFVEIVNEFTEGATMVVHGAPGVGKTSLLREFENTAGRDGTARVVRLRRKSFASSDQFLTDLAAGLNVNGGLRLKELKGKANFLVARGEVTFERVEGGSFTQAIRDLCTWGVGGTGVIVALDEAQELADLPERSSAKDIFLELHEGIPGVKIGAVYVGLSNLPLVLEHLASPRLDSDLKMPMPLFKEGETREFVHRTLDYLGATGTTQRDAMGDWAEQHCGRWPQHAVNFVRSAAKEMLAENFSDLEHLNAERVRRRVERDRADYYASRWSGFAGRKHVVLAAHDATDENGADFDTLYDAVAQTLGGDHDEVLGFVDKMFRRGHFHSVGTDLYKCPIASLKQWGRNRAYRAPDLDISGRNAFGN